VIKKYLIYIVFAIMCGVIGGAYWIYSAPVRAIDEANVESIGELVVNTKVEILQDQLETVKHENKYLKNITPLIIIKPVDDVAKIQVLQDKIDTLNKLNINKTVYENINSNYADESYPIYVFEPAGAPPKANILREIMKSGGSYTDAYDRAQREGK
jgi:hypothetical protein